MRHTRSVRLIAILMTFLASLSAPGAAVAHGLAHHREHEGGHHAGLHDAPTAVERAPHGHDQVHASPGHHGSAMPEPPRVAAPDEPGPVHGHPTLDLPVRPRVEVAVILPAVLVATLLTSHEVDVEAGTPVPHAALPRPDPDAAPPPRTRAPPLR